MESRLKKLMVPESAELDLDYILGERDIVLFSCFGLLKHSSMKNFLNIPYYHINIKFIMHSSMFNKIEHYSLFAQTSKLANTLTFKNTQ